MIWICLILISFHQRNHKQPFKHLSFPDSVAINIHDQLTLVNKIFAIFSLFLMTTS